MNTSLRMKLGECFSFFLFLFYYHIPAVLVGFVSTPGPFFLGRERDEIFFIYYVFLSREEGGWFLLHCSQCLLPCPPWSSNCLCSTLQQQDAAAPPRTFFRPFTSIRGIAFLLGLQGKS